MDNVEIDIKEIVAILKRQRRLIVVTVVLLLGLAFAYVLTATPIYRATTLIMVDGRGSNLLDEKAGDSQQSAVLNSRVDGEVEILRSQATALAVIEDHNLIASEEFGPRLGWREKLGMAMGVDLSSNALRGLVGLAPKDAPSESALVNSTIARLRNAVEVRRQGLTYLIAISVNSENPRTAADVANAYAETYIARQVATKTDALVSAREVLTRQIATAQAQLAEAENAVNSFIEDNLARLEAESGDPEVAALRRQLESAQAENMAATGRISAAEGAMAQGDWTAVASSLGDVALAELDRQRRELQNRLGTAAEGSPIAIELAAELERLQGDLERRANRAIAGIRSDVASFGSRQQEARDALRETLLRSDMSADLLADLYSLQQSATIARSQYQTLLAREQDMRTLANIQVADARVVSEALPPNGPSAPNKRLILMMAVVGGVGLGVLLAFLKEYYVGGISSASQLQNVMQARVPVTVPQIDPTEGGSPADVIINQPMSVYAETFRKLRANIDMRREQAVEAGTLTPRAGGQIILMTSALQAEGKTTSAIALARTYALSGANTLLIDADLRKPAIASRLGVQSETGLLEYLNAWGTSEALELKTAADPLSPLEVLTAGQRSSAPTDQLMNSKGFRALVQAASEAFDVVIIDTPPLLPVVDTRYLARHADTVVQVVRYGTTTQGEVREAAAQLQEMMRPDAVLFGMLSHEERGSRRYGYYGRYAYYGAED